MLAGFQVGSLQDFEAGQTRAIFETTTAVRRASNAYGLICFRATNAVYPDRMQDIRDVQAGLYT